MPDPVSFPVADAFYFVDVPPHDAAAVAQAGARGACASWTIVCVQMTKQDNHDTTTGAVPRLMARMRECFRNRDVVKQQLSWDGLPASPRRKGDEEAAGVRDGCREVRVVGVTATPMRSGAEWSGARCSWTTT
ncbi:putative retrotransposon hot spot protein 4 (RHS4) [Trypanosoma vivax]|nr:putative retrotransposon hot spot protein 4 (RHS4) [Trypanosoma vivax]